MNHTTNVKAVFIKKTIGEWQVIDRKIQEGGKKDLAAYLRCEILRLNKKYEKCPDCITEASGEKVSKRPYIPKTIYADLEKIALRMDIPISKVVDRLIIAPLLLPD